MTKMMMDDAIPTGVAWLDAMLGGGILRGHLYLITGPAGVGKTMLCCQILSGLAANGSLAENEEGLPQPRHCRGLLLSGEEGMATLTNRLHKMDGYPDGVDVIHRRLSGVGELFGTINGLASSFVVVDALNSIDDVEMQMRPFVNDLARRLAAQRAIEANRVGLGTPDTQPPPLTVVLVMHRTKREDPGSAKFGGVAHLVDVQLDLERQPDLPSARVDVTCVRNRFAVAGSRRSLYLSERGLLAEPRDP